MNRYLTLSLSVLAAALLLVGCDSGLADLDVPNTNDPTRESALQSGEDIRSLLAGTTTETMQATVSEWGPHMDLLADQITSTNAFRSFWDFAEEPRLTLNNRPTYATPTAFTDPWSNFNSGQAGANQILRITDVEGNSITVGGSDVTAKMRASAYFLRGVARGHLGMIYDQAFLVSAETDPLEIDPGSLEPTPYGQMIDAAVSDLEQAISIAENNGFSWDLLLNNSYSNAQFQEIAHSFAAKFLLSKARTQQEAQNFSAQYLDRIISHANQGVGQGGALESFTPTSTDGEYYHANADWGTFVISGPAGYLPTDLKITHLMDPDYPVEYPSASGEVLGPAESPDPRAGYFSYTEAFGFLSAARNRSLFSNYWRLRTYAANSWFLRSGDPVMTITNSEVQYLKAEAHLLKGERGAAATALENSPFGTVPTELEIQLPIIREAILESGPLTALADLSADREISSSNSMAEFVRALHYEYSVELDLMTTIGTQWFFMRRHGLLQEGTPLHYPVPGEELQVLRDDYYTFGGVDNAGSEGTASGDNSWRTFDDRNGISEPVGFESSSEKTQSPVRIQSENLDVETPPRAEQQ